ncbi:MAG TPA: sugar kinase [Akkermansia muciniphila]|nr:sugar kinase [Akkermansia muciniphila]
MSFSEPCALAVDFGGTSIKMGVTAGERILATADRIPTAMFESPQAIIDAMIASARTLRGQFPSACVMGMGMPGWCDYQRGVLYQLTNVRVWDREIPVKEMMEQALGLPVVLDNDANCMAYAEWKLGAGKGKRHLVCLTLGTGVGSGLIVNGELLRGSTCSAGELGQTSIDYRGRLGHYGNRGSLEDYVGNREIAADARTLYASHGIDKAIVDCNPIALERAALAGDEVAEQVWRDLAVKLSCALMNCCYLLNPEAIIIGGGVAKAKTLLFQPLQEIMKAQLAAPLVEYLEILPAQFGTEAGILGAAHLALNTHFGETFRA